MKKIHTKLLSVLLTLSTMWILGVVPAGAITYSVDTVEQSSISTPEDSSSSLETYPIPTEAQLDALTEEDWEILDDITEGGFVSLAQAFQILRVDKIVDKLETYGQIVTSVDDQIVVLPDENGINHLTDEETAFIICVLSQEVERANSEETISREEAFTILQEEMEENPQCGTYSVDMGAGHVMVVTTTVEPMTAIEEDSFVQKAIAAGEWDLVSSNSTSLNNGVSTQSGYLEEEIMSERETVTTDGRYSKEYELKEFNGTSYSKNMVSVVTEYTNNAYEASMDTLRSGQSAYGTITVGNASASIVVPSTSYCDNATEWCEATNQVVFTSSSSITLMGVFSFSASSSWTQYAIIRSSIVAMHAYAGIYY